jgi:hypothetical protein
MNMMAGISTIGGVATNGGTATNVIPMNMDAGMMNAVTNATSMNAEPFDGDMDSDESSISEITLDGDEKHNTNDNMK